MTKPNVAPCKVCGKIPPFPGGTRCQRTDCGLIEWSASPPPLPQVPEPEWLARYRQSARPDHQACARDYDTLRAAFEQVREDVDSMTKMCDAYAIENQRISDERDRLAAELDAMKAAVRDFDKSTQWMQVEFDIAEESGELGFWPEGESIKFCKIVEARKKHAAAIAAAKLKGA